MMGISQNGQRMTWRKASKPSKPQTHTEAVLLLFSRLPAMWPRDYTGSSTLSGPSALY